MLSDLEPRAHKAFRSPLHRSLYVVEYASGSPVAVLFPDGVEYLLVFAEYLVEAELLPPEDEGCARRLVGLGDRFVDAAEKLVSGRRHDLGMEDPVPLGKERFHVFPAGLDDGPHLSDGLPDLPQVLGSAVFRHDSCGFRLDHHADLKDLQHHGRRPVTRKDELRQFVPGHEDSLPVPYFQQPEGFEHGDGLSEKGPSDAQGCGHVPF
ncbi:hypothetical protein SDC9_58189 [bioreactor metagenome]|uniref:Uncharacterized protein n=1 Tax=bioreactor metagenome TaxID=1076179 RepID=A0A644X7Q0_9ZZZZ